MESESAWSPSTPITTFTDHMEFPLASVSGAAASDLLAHGFHHTRCSRYSISTSCLLAYVSSPSVDMKTVTHVNWSCAQHSSRHGRPSDKNPSFQPMSI